jgi:hypothetical protein
MVHKITFSFLNRVLLRMFCSINLTKLLLISHAHRRKKISTASCPGAVYKPGKDGSSGSSESGSETHKSLGGSPLTQPRNASRCGGDQFRLRLGEFSGRSSRLFNHLLFLMFHRILKRLKSFYSVFIVDSGRTYSFR